MKQFFPYGAERDTAPLDPDAQIPKTAPLEQVLRAEGHEVREVRGPVGTTEHVLLLRRAGL